MIFVFIVYNLMVSWSRLEICIWSWAHFLSLARSKLRLCSANHRPGYWSNLPCDWLSTVWAYSEQETENGPWSNHTGPYGSKHSSFHAAVMLNGISCFIGLIYVVWINIIKSIMIDPFQCFKNKLTGKQSSTSITTETHVMLHGHKDKLPSPTNPRPRSQELLGDPNYTRVSRSKLGQQWYRWRTYCNMEPADGLGTCDLMHAFYFITWVILYVYTCICTESSLT